VHVGEVAEVAFVAENRTDASTTGTASFNVTPNVAGVYFNKLACFCFTEQSLAAGQSLDMPVQFFVDPAIAEDHELDYINRITLSYTFYPVVNSQTEPVAAAGADGEANAL
jgi:cytochrome c oxidase assembly protein subunit 11